MKMCFTSVYLKFAGISAGINLSCEILANESGPTASMMVVPVPMAMSPAQFDAGAALAEIAALTQQITDSETNLRAQFDSIEPQREVAHLHI